MDLLIKILHYFYIITSYKIYQIRNDQTFQEKLSLSIIKKITSQ